jgi:hypothetical protein
MNKKEFCEILEQEKFDTESVKVSITTAKGLITFFWSITFLDKTNIEYFKEKYNEIQIANDKIKNLAKKYSDYYVNHKVLREVDANHFDHIRYTTKERPVKRSWQTETQSFGGYVQFIYPKEN